MTNVKRDRPADNAQASEQIVYVLPSSDNSNDEINLIDLWNILWGGKLWVVAVTVAVTLVAIAYSLLATERYRSEALLIPNEENASQSLTSRLGGLGGLAGLAGITVGGSDSTEALAVLQSRAFARAFIEDKNLMPILFSKEWDESAQRWQSDEPERQPDIRDGVRVFVNDVRSVSNDARTGLVTLSVVWTDPELAAQWASEMVVRLNDTMRARALGDAERNIEYLQAELENTNVATLRDAIGSVLETELQKVMLAKGNEEFAFRVVDPPQVPKLREWPNRSLIAATAILLGGMLGALIVLIRHLAERRKIADMVD